MKDTDPKPSPHRNGRALNAAASQSVFRALCFQLELGANGEPPEWIPYLPAPEAGGRVVGEDGRTWTIKDARALCGKVKRKLPLDINHSTELQAPIGGESPAAGFMTEFQVRADGSTWAKVDWNKRGRNAIAEREYAFVSPVFDFSKNGEIVRFVSAALCNQPNFGSMPALNTATPTQEESPMLERLLALLGLTAAATEADAERAINTMKADLQRATNAAQSPPLERFVPRADHDAVLARATNAEQKLKDQAKQAHDAEIEAEIKSALQAGKITPATESFYRATCAQEGGLEQFRAFVKTAVPVVGDSQVDARPPEQKLQDGESIAERALNYQKAQAGLGRIVSSAAAVTHVTTQKASA